MERSNNPVTKEISRKKGHKFRTPKRVLALRDNDLQSLRRSSSGGAFPVLARPVIASGGKCYGAKLCEDGVVRHVCISTLGGIALLQGSVYTQSVVENVFNLIEDNLKSGERVLFVGTPCQSAALVSCLVRHEVIDSLETSDNLIVCDLICHGTPKQELFQAHQAWLAKKVKADDGLHDFRFRSKRHGWGLNYQYSYYRNGRKREVCEQCDNDPYYYAFLRGLTYRRGCFSCLFSQKERVSDFTLGDYWGIKRAHPEFYDNKGVSVVLVNTVKGDSYFDSYCQTSCTWIQSSFELASKENLNLVRPTPKPENYEELASMVEESLNEREYDRLFEDILKPPFSLERKLRRILPDAVFSFLRRVKRLLVKRRAVG